MQVELTGKIYLSDLDTDLRELVGGLRFEFVESTIEMNHGYISAESGITGFKAMNESYKKVIGATKISFKFGLQGKGRRQEFIEAIENVNPSPVNTKGSRGIIPGQTEFKNMPRRLDSLDYGFSVKPR